MTLRYRLTGAGDISVSTEKCGEGEEGQPHLIAASVSGALRYVVTGAGWGRHQLARIGTGGEGGGSETGRRKALLALMI